MRQIIKNMEQQIYDRTTIVSFNNDAGNHCFCGGCVKMGILGHGNRKTQLVLFRKYRNYSLV